MRYPKCGAIIFIFNVLLNTMKSMYSQSPSNLGNYSLSGDALCLEYFQIEDYTGTISPKKDLQLNTNKPSTYTVSKRDGMSIAINMYAYIHVL
jgi:hypothetical protein